MEIQFAEFTPSERQSVDTILSRMARIVRAAGRTFGPQDCVTVEMDIAAVHVTCPLDLERMAAGADFDLAHDVYGINRHLDRDTGELRDFFCPRFAR